MNILFWCYLTQIWFVGINFMESHEDYAIIRLQDYNNPRYKHFSAQWHSMSAYSFVAYCLTPCFFLFVLFPLWEDSITKWHLLCGLLMLVAMMFNRLAFFSVFLNIHLKGYENWGYIGNTATMDKKMRKYFGSSAGKIIYISTFIISLVCNFGIYKFLTK